jgi:hypothetical protein
MMERMAMVFSSATSKGVLIAALPNGNLFMWGKMISYHYIEELA